MKNKRILFFSLIVNILLFSAFTFKEGMNNIENSIEYYDSKIIKSLNVYNSKTLAEVEVKFYENGLLKGVKQITKYKSFKNNENLIEFQEITLDSNGNLKSHLLMKDYKIISKGYNKGSKYHLGKK